MDKKGLEVEAKRIAENAKTVLRSHIYRQFASEMEGLEHARKWLGNGHHAAQRMQGKIMKVLDPLIEKVVSDEVLR